MPSLSTARRIASMKNNGAKTIGQIHKENSDFVMEQTFENDIQTRVCYIYDYYRDDQKSKKDHMTYENTTKTKIDAKFIVKTYQSIDKDQVEYYLQFRPSQPTEFSEGDELYYFEKEYRSRYGNLDFIGLYVDIPDDKGIYRKWMIVKKEIANQFIKYLILPINYELMWVEHNGQERILRRMWCTLRSQNSYNSGLWSNYTFTSMENQKKVWLPLNPITEKFWYTNDNTQNMRVLVGALTEKPVAWTISKVENANELGIQMLTLYQDFFNEHTDYVNLETGEMYADYYSSDISPIDPTEPTPTPSFKYGTITASTSTIKIGGSYKTLTTSVYDENGTDITDSYSDAVFNWTCSIEDADSTELATVITWLDGTTFNKKKIKFSNNRSYLEKILKVKCEIIKDTETIEAIMQFDLVI